MFIPRNVADVSKRDIRGFYSHLPVIVSISGDHSSNWRTMWTLSIDLELPVCVCEKLLERRTTDGQVRRVHLKRSVVYEIVLRRQKRKGVVRSCNIM